MFEEATSPYRMERGYRNSGDCIAALCMRGELGALQKKNLSQQRLMNKYLITHGYIMAIIHHPGKESFAFLNDRRFFFQQCLSTLKEAWQKKRNYGQQLCTGLV